MKDSQKRQIRESFRQCCENPRFALKEWILCVPLDLSQDEISWFAQWRAKETSELLPPARIDWWGETKLGNLLLLPTNAGIKEAFFPQEHFRQLAEIQDTLTYLVDDLRTRPAQPDLANLVLQQRTGDAWQRYKEDAYAPLYSELAQIQEALKQARGGHGPFPLWIPVMGTQRPETFRYSNEMALGNMPAFALWPKSRHNFHFFGAFSTAALGRLDDLQQRLVEYNDAVEAVRPAALEALTRAFSSALEQATQDPEYQHWKVLYKETSPSPPYQPHRWFEWVERNSAPSNATPGRDAAYWCLRPPLTTLGWLLVGNAAQAGLDLYVEYERLQGIDFQQESWFQHICENALEGYCQLGT